MKIRLSMAENHIVIENINYSFQYIVELSTKNH